MKIIEERKVEVNNYSEALYNENRNAVPSWQGYEYQGKVAIEDICRC